MLWHCSGCTAAYSVDAPACPQCGSTKYEEDGDMPKIHKGRPPTDEACIVHSEPPVDPGPPEELPEPAQDKPSPRPRSTRAQAGHARASGQAKS